MEQKIRGNFLPAHCTAPWLKGNTFDTKVAKDMRARDWKNERHSLVSKRQRQVQCNVIRLTGWIQFCKQTAHSITIPLQLFPFSGDFPGKWSSSFTSETSSKGLLKVVAPREVDKSSWLLLSGETCVLLLLPLCWLPAGSIVFVPDLICKKKLKNI